MAVSWGAIPAVLAGLRVLDLSRVLAGPYCGQILGDLGAEVIKIERPGVGDETRAWGPPFHPTGPSAYYLACNRNKRGITIDLALPEGREVFYSLLRHSDVVLENYLPSSAEKLGLLPAQLFQIQPRVVVCSISGFGRSGPWNHLPGYDFAIQALSGLMNITGPVEGPPSKVGVAVTDVLTGVYAATAILACLHAREKTGHGYAIDLSLLDCAVASQVNVLQAYLTQLELGRTPAQAVPARQGNAHLQIVPYQLFATTDSWLVLAVGNDRQWELFARTFLPALADDPRFATNPARVEHRASLIPLVEACLRTHTTQEWVHRLEALGIPHAPLWSYADLLAQPHSKERRHLLTVRDSQGRSIDLVGSPFHIAGAGEAEPSPEPLAPPAPGQHTRQVLQSLCGYSDEQIAHLRACGVIA
ncbi:MAG: CoA transferase [Gemmataceae bacterium]